MENVNSILEFTRGCYLRIPYSFLTKVEYDYYYILVFIYVQTCMTKYGRILFSIDEIVFFYHRRTFSKLRLEHQLIVAALNEIKGQLFIESDDLKFDSSLRKKVYRLNVDISFIHGLTSQRRYAKIYLGHLHKIINYKEIIDNNLIDTRTNPITVLRVYLYIKLHLSKLKNTQITDIYITHRNKISKDLSIDDRVTSAALLILKQLKIIDFDRTTTDVIEKEDGRYFNIKQTVFTNYMKKGIDPITGEDNIISSGDIISKTRTHIDKFWGEAPKGHYKKKEEDIYF